MPKKPQILEKMKKTVLFMLGISLFLLLALSCEKENGSDDIKVGDRIRHFNLVMSDGTTLQYEDIARGRTLITFFNTGCKDCRRELPHLQKVYETYQDSMNIVAVSRDEDASSVADYWQKNNLTIPYSATGDREIYSLFCSSGIPKTYLIIDGIVNKIWDEKDYLVME